MSEINKQKYNLQEIEYETPYHHLVNFRNFSGALIMPWPFEYYSYISYVIKRVLETKPKSVIDVGCGDGKLLLELARKQSGLRLLGIDLSERAILFAKSFAYGSEIEYEVKKIQDIQEKFDVATCSEVFEHIPDEQIADFQKSIVNTLKPGGLLFVTVPSTNYPLNPKHFRHYNVEILTKQLVDFELQEYKYLYKYNFVSNLLNRIQRKFASVGAVSRLIFSVQNKYFYFGTENDGGHLFAILKRK